ncbi:secretin N-terminal domain-containing protein [Aeoliella sp.]|uniref:secretin N-terminal domain-containing protein n=1 Tax=Aeoliella sp. TaxID=2795800 RepID=UPI003CCC2C9D
MFARCRWLAICAIAVVLMGLQLANSVTAQQPVRGGFVPAPGQPGVQPASGPQPGVVATPQPSNQTPPDQQGEQPNEENKPNESGEEKKPDEAQGEQTQTITRPDKPPKIADPRELEAEPDSSGRVTFSFNGQLWPDVLQWLANVSGYSLDWTELPKGYLNLSTQRAYTLPEARDLINRQLHARGYTMILAGEVLSVFKIDQLDPSLVPRVEEEDLYDLQPYDFVKITFALPEGVEVAAAAEDIKKTASAHAKVIPLPATRRVLMISTVASARLVSSILNEERLATDGQVVPVEIVLQHRRAEKIIDILYVVLGLDPASRPSQQELAVQQQKMQLLQQMQGAGKDISKMLQKDGPQVFLAFNSHRNSVLINAPPAELKKIRRTIELLDVPAGGESVDIAELAGHRVPRSYKLETIDPRTLLSTLEEIGDLSPLTELRADNRADILFARATEADHEKIAQMIEQLDEAGMETMVFTLRKHPADAVAGTLRTMFAPKKEEKDNNNRYRGWDPWGYNPYEQNQDEPPTDVRVDADIENNRLIVRATPEQLQEVRDFLLKIGEPLDEPDKGDRIRVVDALPPEETAQLLQELRRLWPQAGKNQLLIEGPAGVELRPPAAGPNESTVPTDRETRTEAADGKVFQFAVESAPQATPESEPNNEPPVTVKIAPDGRLVLSSEDTEALNQLEELIESTLPPQERFRIFQIHYVRAYSIYLTLENLYKEEMKGEDTDGYFDTYIWEYIPGKSKSVSPQMSKRRKLQLDWDPTSNTLLVANASPSQLHEIETLIKEYDKPSEDDDAATRRTAAIKLKYSRAKVVAAALKEVYRDLLSSRDKEFETEDKKGSATTKETTTIIRYGQQNSSSDTAKRPTPVKVGFQGALSVGVDEISNTIIISVQEELFESVLQIVNSLDEAAKPDTSVTVHTVNGGVSSEALQKALTEAFGTPWVGGKPEKPEQPNNQQQPGGQQPGQPGQQQPGGQPQAQPSG